MSEARGFMTLGELAELNAESLGTTTPKDRTFKYIDLSSVSHGSIDIASLEQFRFVDAPSRARRVVRDGDILFGTVRPQLRSHARVVGDGFVASTGFSVVRPRPDVADGGFLGHFLLSDEAALQAARREVGSNYPAVTEQDVASFRLPRIPLAEQRRIAGILDAIDEAIRATERVISKHVRVRAGLARDLLAESSRCIPPRRLDQGETDSPSAPTRTSTGLASDEVLLKDCGHWFSGGTPDTGNPDYWGGEIPWITASSLKGRYLSTSVRRLTPAGARAGTRVVPPQAILFVIRGMSLKKEFRVGMTVRSVAFGQDCKALVPADGVDPKYLLFALEAAETHVLKMVDESTHGTGRLQTSLLGSLKVWLPPLDHQRRITAVLDTIDEATQGNEEQLGKLRQLRSGLAADLLSGQVSTVAA